MQNNVKNKNNVVSESRKLGEHKFRNYQSKMAEGNGNYEMRKVDICEKSKGSKSLSTIVKQNAFDFDDIGVRDMQDSARQNITTKKNYPVNILGMIMKGERVNFARNNAMSISGKKNGGEIVVDVELLFDFDLKKMMRSYNGKQGSEEMRVIDFANSTIRLHLPKRYQDRLDGLADANLLRGSLIVCPKYDMNKWSDKNDENKSSIPLIILFKNKKSIDYFDMDIDSYPSFDDFREESQKCLKDDAYGCEENVNVKILVDYMNEGTKQFYAKETHNSNLL